VRLQAAEMFAQDADPVQVARSLRVSTKSVYQWRRVWRAGQTKTWTEPGEHRPQRHSHDDD
jgi:transposase-like protein